MSKTSRHRANLSNGSSEDANSSTEIKSQSAWDRIRRPSTASSTKRPQFNESNRSFSSMSTTLARNKPSIDSPTAMYFPGHTHEMVRSSMDDNYLHILAARKANQDSETSSIASFSCSLATEFDRQREEADSNPIIAQNPDRKQNWLDNCFARLSDMYRIKRDPVRANSSSDVPCNPHFLDLSSIISPSPYGARSTYDDVKTPQAELDRQLMADFNTPKPTQTQHFKSSYLGSDMRLPSPPLLSPMTATFTLEPLGNSNQQNLASMTRARVMEGSAPRAIRKQKSFDNPSEIRRRQKQEWKADENRPNALSIAIPSKPKWARSRSQRSNGSELTSPHSVALPPLPVHSQLSHLARPVQMSRGVSQDTASRQQEQNSPVRPKLGSRTSSSALRHMATFDPASSTGFSFARPPALLPASRESYGSSTGSESLPQTPVSANYLRGLPYINTVSPPRNYPDAAEQKEHVREWDNVMTKDAHIQMQQQQQQQQQLGSALGGLMPGKLVRAYSDSPAQMSRLRSGSDSSNGSEDFGAGVVTNSYQTPRPSQNQQRPGFRREHTTNPVSSPSKRPLNVQPFNGIATTPRSSSLKDIQAELRASPSRNVAKCRTSMDSLESASDDTESSLAYTKPSPLIAQRSNSGGSSASSLTASPGRSMSRSAFPYQLEREESHATGLSITPTNSYRADLGEANVSKWSPSTPPVLTERRRDQSRAEEWGANLRKLTRGTAA